MSLQSLLHKGFCWPIRYFLSANWVMPHNCWNTSAQAPKARLSRAYTCILSNRSPHHHYIVFYGKTLGCQRGFLSEGTSRTLNTRGKRCIRYYLYASHSTESTLFKSRKVFLVSSCPNSLFPSQDLHIQSMYIRWSVCRQILMLGISTPSSHGYK